MSDRDRRIYVVSEEGGDSGVTEGMNRGTWAPDVREGFVPVGCGCI